MNEHSFDFIKNSIFKLPVCKIKFGMYARRAHTARRTRRAREHVGHVNHVSM